MFLLKVVEGWREECESPVYSGRMEGGKRVYVYGVNDLPRYGCVTRPSL